jgi:hypothetical protein
MKPYPKNFCSLLLGGAFLFSAAQPSHAAVETLYAPDFGSVSGNELPGWQKQGGYGEPAIVMDWSVNTSSGLPALHLDSQFYEPNGGADIALESSLLGDTAVPYEPGASYRLSFILARADTGGSKDDDLAFYGGLRYQLWAGNPNSTGVMLGEGRVSAVRTEDAVKDTVVSLDTAKNARGRGNLFIRITTMTTAALGENPYRYQQAEINDLRLEKILSED